MVGGDLQFEGFKTCLNVMNIIINNPQLVRVVLLYMDMYYGDLIPKDSLNRSDFIHFVNSENYVILDYDKWTYRLFVDRQSLYDRITSQFPIDNFDIEWIIKDWFEKKYNLKVYQIYRGGRLKTVKFD